MEFKTIAKEYIKLFILVIENAGWFCKNSTYSNVEAIINRSGINKLIDTGQLNFDSFISALISYLLIDMYSKEFIDELDAKETVGRINSIYELYLKEPTRIFTQRNALPTVPCISGCFKLEVIRNHF